MSEFNTPFPSTFENHSELNEEFIDDLNVTQFEKYVFVNNN